MPNAVLDFESDVLKSFEECLRKSTRILTSDSYVGVAVSGGADSISLLVSLKSVLPYKIKAVTVNHNLRSEAESAYDADYVEDICRALKVKCVRYDIKRGEIAEIRKMSKTSGEDAARKVRYEKFEQFIREENISVLCLAHTKSDQIETILMRFLQGSDSLLIPQTRGIFFRPLLNIDRGRIEAYLKAKNIKYVVDSTNNNEEIFRNRVRIRLVPFLESKFSGFDKAITSFAEKKQMADSFISEVSEKAFSYIDYKLSSSCVSFNRKNFFNLPLIIRIKVVFKAIEFIQAKKRISYGFVRDMVCTINKDGRKACGGIEFCFSNDLIYIRKKQEQVTDKGFYVIIKNIGSFTINGLNLNVSYLPNRTILLEMCDRKLILKDLRFPFVVKNRQPGDIIENDSLSPKKVSDILDKWRAGEKKDCIPLIQKLRFDRDSFSQNICCIWGSPFGFKDWIVK